MRKKVDWRDAVVTTWGGLRGAVGLALALMVFNETGTICDRVRQIVARGHEDDVVVQLHLPPDLCTLLAAHGVAAAQHKEDLDPGGGHPGTLLSRGGQ